MTLNIQHEKTKTILDCFEKISQIPRGSKNEQAISDWLMNWAKEHGFAARRDAVLNVVIEVPGTAGYEKSPPAVIQGHMDMVCEKTKDSPHDFTKDPIKFVFDGDWLKADRTTLGSDNGIAIAMAMTAATADDVPHPPLELLFTVDEETGLTGANALGSDFIKGKILLNVDSEDEGVFTVGCAGGRDTHLTLALDMEAPPAGYESYKLVVEGFSGGHSGVDIHQQRGNACRALGRALYAVAQDADLRLFNMHGGSAHNAIPRDAEAVLFLPKGAIGGAKKAVAAVEAALKSEYAKTDANIKLLLEPEATKDVNAAWSAACTAKAIDMTLAVPHGVEAYSADIDGLVETSNNLATIRTTDGKLIINSSQRSSVMDCLNLLTSRVEAVARLAGGDACSDSGYPAWQPRMDSPLLEKCKALYKSMYDKEPVVEIIHAGLECGIIGAKYEGMDMISFGPTIKNPHSPDEKIHVKSIGLVWDFMAALLKSLK